ncbi:MAG: ATP-binding cassette domain-containing protein [Eggerthellaceae bacterium]|nr:ATP-binding cassette domain-containing protein [Eggerthellaceae bacterium]
MEPVRNVPAIEVFGFTFAYGDRLILGPVDWTVKEGSLTLLVGATGCGKTTLLRNMKPELAPTGVREGSIRVFGRPIEELSASESAQTIGYVSQSPDNQIVCDTVWHEMAFGLENLAIPQDEMHRRVAEVAHFFGIEPWLDNATNELSGGQKQLLTLASILALRPRILLLDEPTGQLDPVASKNFLHALFRINRELGLTILMVTHEPETVVDYATAFAVMKDGKVQDRDVEEYRREVHERASSVDFRAEGVCAPAFSGEDVAVTFKDVYVRYKRELPYVLRGLDFTLKKGSVHTLVGGNGSGKSTLLSTMSGIMKIDRGSLKNLLKDNQALLPQDPKSLFVCDTAAEELAEWQKGCGYTDEDIRDLAKNLHIDHVLGQHPYDLSGGQQQLLAFAKIMLTKPALLMVDEPTKGLDVRSKYIVADAICRAAAHGTTVLLVTHDLAFASRVADTTSMIFDGQIVSTEPTSLFFAENLFYRPVIDRFFVTWTRPEMESGI